MGREAGGGLLTYDGTSWRLDTATATDLLARGVIVPGDGQREFCLDPRHGIDEIERSLTPVERSSGDDARGQVQADGRRRLAAARYSHRSGPGGA
jgi:hypothetical protein